MTRNQVIECKYKIELRENFSQLKHKFKAAKKWCNERNYDFIILTEEHINSYYLENCKFLYRYLGSKYNPNEAEKVYQTVYKLGMTTPGETIVFMAGDWEYQAILLHQLWWLVAKGEIYCDLNRKLTMHSEIWIDEYYE